MVESGEDIGDASTRMEREWFGQGEGEAKVSDDVVRLTSWLGIESSTLSAHGQVCFKKGGKKKQKKGKEEKSKREHTLVLVDRRIGSGRAVVVVNRRQTTVESRREIETTKRGNRERETGLLRSRDAKISPRGGGNLVGVGDLVALGGGAGERLAAALHSKVR